jgi:glyceraldehyde 3-phosphate dehydrogenase
MTINEKVSAGVNGFGRVGLHLLKFWLDHPDDAQFDITHVNDPVLTLDDALRIINSDRKLNFSSNYKVTATDGRLQISEPLGTVREIPFTTSAGKPADIPWVGQPRLFVECTGKHAEFPSPLREVLQGDTSHAIISATSYRSDGTLVVGFNHDTFDPERHRVVSYGSCTVNAYVPLAQWFHNAYGVEDSDVHVAHNTQPYKLADAKNRKLFRKACTLEKSGPELLDFLHPESFLVDYAVGPFTNVSGITFRFCVESEVDREQVIADLETAMKTGSLQGLYTMDDVFRGDSNAYACTPFSSVFTRDGIAVRGKNVYLQGYFDNENSVNRLFDLTNHIASKITSHDGTPK